MTGNEITLTVIASVFGLVATILTILTFFKNDKKDGKKDAEEIATIKTDVVYIKDGIGELKQMMQAQGKEQNEMNLKIQKVDDKIEAVELRLDKLEKQRLNLKGAK